MPAVTLDAGLRAKYEALWGSCTINQSRAAEARVIAQRIIEKAERYKVVANRLRADGRFQWQIVAILHNMEASGNFGCHLHNGDPLSARTVQVPAGRPRAGRPPFGWEESAIDALLGHGADKVIFKTMPGVLFWIECFNGQGYLKSHKDVNSPYLWSGTNHYKAGKYVADGKWDQNAISKQMGAAALLKLLPPIELKA